MSGNTACMLTIRSWVFSSSIATLSLAHRPNHKRDEERIEAAAGMAHDCHSAAAAVSERGVEPGSTLSRAVCDDRVSTGAQRQILRVIEHPIAGCCQPAR